MSNIPFTLVDNDYPHNKSTLKDQHDLVKIENKTAILKNIGKFVRGETNSNIITFEMDRYFDNEDLSTKGIQFVVQNSIGILVEPATNVEYNDDSIRFSWVLSDFDTSESKTSAAIEFYGTIDDEQDYCLKTVPFTIEIENSFSSNDMDVYTVSKNLYVNLINRLDELEESMGNTGAISDEIFEFDPIDFTMLMEVTTNEKTN